MTRRPLQSSHEECTQHCLTIVNADRDLDMVDEVIATVPCTVSTQAYDMLLRTVGKHVDKLPTSFSLPAQRTMSRYLSRYFKGFYPHLPFLHLPSTSSDTMSPLLLLTLCAIGAFYGYEHPQGYALYLASNSIVTEALEQRRRDLVVPLTTNYPRYAELPTANPRGLHTDSHIISPHSSVLSSNKDLEILQALVVLAQLTSWVDSPLLQDSLLLTSQLVGLVRDSRGETNWGSKDLELDWHKWHRQEEKRRTLYAAYIVTNLQTLCFDVPPAIPNSSIHIPLPCSAAEWKATNATSWQQARRTGASQNSTFQQCLRQLLRGQPLDKEVSITAFGNYVLIHGLLQQLYFERQGLFCLTSSSPSLPPDLVRSYAAALRAWQSSWDMTSESTLDPASPYGPLGFNSTALVRLAHIRLSVGLAAQCDLTCRDPETLAQPFASAELLFPLQCSHLEQAILQCIYALRIPVRVGIAFVARTQTGQWSVQHAISNFACALLLTRWLENMSRLVEASSMESLEESQKRLILMITHLIEETHLADSLGAEDDDPVRIRRLAVAAVRLWAETFKGIQVFEIVHTIGETLSFVAELLEKRNAR
ncbi:fungal-specific transcription factor domain-containing protein [Ilyonectria sp. MPI-CAGE-AT-0026]|nr:fungal-specific transcription factor domain-containing protein [Ilyonectria sp. MPI-CAGE-AT-0026]